MLHVSSKGLVLLPWLMEDAKDGCFFLAMACTSKGWTVMEKPHLGIGVRSLMGAATANFLAVVDFLSCRGFISLEALVRI